MKTKLIETFREWLVIMLISFVAILFTNVLNFFLGGDTIGFIGALVYLGLCTIIYIIVRLLSPIINFILGI